MVWKNNYVELFYKKIIKLISYMDFSNLFNHICHHLMIVYATNMQLVVYVVHGLCYHTKLPKYLDMLGQAT